MKCARKLMFITISLGLNFINKSGKPRKVSLETVTSMLFEN